MKKISKNEAAKIIKDTDPLQITFHQICRTDTPSSKQSQLNRFISEVRKQIAEDRDIQLFAVKVK